MKNLFTLAIASIVLLGSSFVSFGQDQRARFGVKLGGGVTWMNNSSIAEPRATFNPVVGFGAQFGHRSRPVTLSTELFYSRKGSKLDYNIPNTYIGESRVNIHYLELPVYANFRLSRTARFHVGGYGNVVLGSNQLNYGTFYNDAQGARDGDMSKFDYGVMGGLGLDFNKFKFDVRYTHGLNPIGESEQAKTYYGNGTMGTVEFSITKYISPRSQRRGRR